MFSCILSLPLSKRIGTQTLSRGVIRLTSLLSYLEKRATSKSMRHQINAASLLYYFQLRTLWYDFVSYCAVVKLGWYVGGTSDILLRWVIEPPRSNCTGVYVGLVFGWRKHFKMSALITACYAHSLYFMTLNTYKLHYTPKQIMHHTLKNGEWNSSLLLHCNSKGCLWWHPLLLCHWILLPPSPRPLRLFWQNNNPTFSSLLDPILFNVTNFIVFGRTIIITSALQWHYIDDNYFPI